MKQDKIRIDLEKLNNLITDNGKDYDTRKVTLLSKVYNSQSHTINKAEELLSRGIPYLNNIKLILGSTDELYLELSTKVAKIALNYIIKEVNEVSRNFEIDTKNESERFAAIYELNSILENALQVITLIDTLDVENDFKTNYYHTNKEYVNKIYNTNNEYLEGFFKNIRLSIPDNLMPQVQHSNKSGYKIVNYTWWIGGLIGICVAYAKLATENSEDKMIAAYLGIFFGIFLGFPLGKILDIIREEELNSNNISAIPKWLKVLGGIIIFLILVSLIWGWEGLQVILVIVMIPLFFIFILILKFGRW